MLLNTNAVVCSIVLGSKMEEKKVPLFLSTGGTSTGEPVCLFEKK
jgi:hypothetical protein